MQEQHVRMAFNWEVLVGSSEKHFVCYSQHFVHKHDLRRVVPHVFDNRITEHPIELFVFEWKYPTRILYESFTGKEAVHSRKV